MIVGSPTRQDAYGAWLHHQVAQAMLEVQRLHAAIAQATPPEATPLPTTFAELVQTSEYHAAMAETRDALGAALQQAQADWQAKRLAEAQWERLQTRRQAQHAQILQRRETRQLDESWVLVPDPAQPP